MTRRVLRRSVQFFAVTALTLGPAACQKPLFDASEQRSQFDRYDGVRAQYAPQYIEDEYGQRVPNLRGRLSPKD